MADEIERLQSTVRRFADKLKDAADEIERLRTDRDRWRDVALCHVCKPTANNYCPDHFEAMNAPRPWGTA